jgi:hypothetical protein
MIINNVLSQSEIDGIQEAIAHCPNIEEQSRYGRYMFHDIVIKEDNTFKSTLMHHVVKATGRDDWKMNGAVCAEYTAKAGDPNLPPHFDGDHTDLIMTYQLSSNKTWGVGVDLNVYDLEDNSAILFHPNESIHWRPHAKFEDGEYVRVMFVRFVIPGENSDFRHKSYDLLHPIFDEVNAYRDSL